MKRLSPKLLIFLLVTVGMIALDQATKILVVHTLRYGIDEVHIIPGLLSFVHAQNPGAALSMGADWDPNTRLLVFGTFTVIACGVVLWTLVRLPREDRVQSASLAFILAGALGNFIDRVDKRTVTDFIRVYTESSSLKPWLIAHFGTNEYPIFNIADMALWIGVGLFLLYYVAFADRDEPLVEDDLAV